MIATLCVMSRLRSALAVCFFVVLPTVALGQAQYQAYGHGNSTCAALLAHRLDAREAQAWVLGFLSGMNAMNEGNHLVGSTLTNDQMFAELLLDCERQPDAAIADVTQRLYLRAAREGK